MRKVRRSESEMENKDSLNPDMFKSILPQRVLRDLANDNEILEIVKDLIQQDKTAHIIICGDFNKQLPRVTKELRKVGFVGVF